MKNKYTAAFFCLLMCAGIYLFHVTYKEAREKAVNELTSRQLIFAENAKAEIEFFFNNIIHILSELSASSHIIDFDDTGKEELDLAFQLRPAGIKAITRVDAAGNAIYTTPSDDGLTGAQAPMEQLTGTQHPVASDISDSPQGYQAICVHLPLYRGGEFRGALGVVIDFLAISKGSLQNIRIGETGSAWMTSREGNLLYGPVSTHVGSSVFDTFRDSATGLSMAGKMLRGEQGTATYEYHRAGEGTAEVVTYHAVFLPVTVVDSVWSLVIASEEEEVLASLATLRNKLFMIPGLLLILSILFSYFSIKARIIVRNEERRKADETKIRQLSQFRESIIDNANVWLNVLDESGNIVVWNKAAESISGYSKEEVVGHGAIWEWLYPDTAYREEIFLKATAIIQGNKVADDLETRIRQKDGKEKIIAWHSRNFTDDTGNVVGAITLGRDITEQKLAEEALGESSRKYTQLIEDIGPSMVIFSFQLDGTITYVSSSVKAMTGLERGSILGRKWQDLLDWEPDSFKIATEENRKLTHGQKHNDYELSFTDKGVVRTVHIQSHLIEDREGNRLIEGTATDITSRKQAEREREKLIEELQDALKNVKTLSGLLPICSNCKKIRDDQGYWNHLESYIEKHSSISFSHGLCRECAAKLYGHEEWFKKK